MTDVNTNSDVNISSNNDFEGGWHTGYIHGNTFKNKEVKFRKINGMAIFEGDIILASTPEEMERLSPKKPSFDKKIFVKAVARTGEQFRWPRGEIPYEIRSSVPNQNRITDAIYHWEERTHIRFIPRTKYNAKYYPNYVSFIQYTPQPGEKQEEVFHCSSPIGMQGSGEQSVVVSDQCITGDVIHEIGHTVGLWHEQSREDRDNYIRVVFDNIEPKDVHNFSQHVSDGDDVGDYDYASIMHYGASYFSKNGLPTIEVLKIESPDAGSIGQKNGLSAGDIAAVNLLYANKAPTVINNIGGKKLDVFTRSSGQIYRSSQKTSNDSKSYTGWSPIGAYCGLRTSITSDKNDKLDIVDAGTNLHHLYQIQDKWYTDMHFITNSKAFIGEPVVLRDANDIMEVVCVGNDTGSDNSPQLFHEAEASSTTSGWNDPTMLGGPWPPNRRPFLARSANGRLEIFVVDYENQLYHRWQTSNATNQWSDGWNPLGGPFYGDPVVALDSGNKLEIFIVGFSDNQLYYRRQISPNSNQWSDGWDPLEGYWHPYKRPFVARNNDGRLYVFIVGTDGRMYHKWQTSLKSDGLWDWNSTWVQLGKEEWPRSSNPTVARNGDGRLEIFIVGPKEEIYHKWQTSATNSNQWSDGWVTLIEKKPEDNPK